MAGRDDLKLIEPTEELASVYIEMVEEFHAAGEPSHGEEREEIRKDFAAFVEKLRNGAKDRELPEGPVPANTYWLVRGGELLGTARLRHRLTPLLEQEGGHIGYDIRPSRRGRGYATRLLAMMLKKAKALGLRRVLLTCNKDNSASARAIEKNGGQLEDERLFTRTGRPGLRYWIDLGAGGDP